MRLELHSYLGKCGINLKVSSLRPNESSSKRRIWLLSLLCLKHEKIFSFNVYVTRLFEIKKIVLL